MPFPVVGIGASAGGLEAFKKFFAALPPDCGIAFILIPHLDPAHRSLMVELLARETAMKVCEAGDGLPIEPNCVYIIPPNSNMSVSNGRLRLTRPKGLQGFGTALDGFFRSLAESQQETAIGIILSGTGSHGIPGLREIKAVGGMVMAQDPRTAEYDQMPQSAIETGLIDYVLPPEKMPEALVSYVRQPYLHPRQPLPAVEAATAQIAPVLDLLRTRSRFDFRCYRKNMLVRRIQRRMGICQLDGVSDYVAYLREHPEEITALYRDLMIGVTSFFRDPEAFQALQQQVIRELVERQSGEIPVRVWVPACSTGEEAYSLAILLLEQFTATKKPANFQIFASDIDEESVEIARRGIYAASAVCELSPERVQRFFVKTDESHYQVTKQLRGFIVVTRQNVISDAPFSKLDLISCRNLLIYLEPELQQKVISLFHFALLERGALFLGCSESIGRQTDLFEPVSKKWRVFRRIGPARHDLVQVPIVADADRRIGVSRVEPAPRPRMGFAELMQKLLLARFAPAAALINRKYEVLSLSGRTSDYLELPTGELTSDLLSLLRQGLRTRIRAACQKVLSSDETVATIDARLPRNGASVVCTIGVSLLHEPREAEGLLLVTFQDRTEETPPRSPLALATDEESAVVRQLEHEVETTREDLQSTIEELQSSNEEVMSMNEELQSANEELETSKEELQSFNEELSTVNSQLQDKVEELERANNDFRNLLISTEIATVFLDTDLRIKRFTPATAQLLHLIESDIGRPIRDFAIRFTDQSLLRDAGRVLDKAAPVETVVCSEEGRYYLRRILPYRTSDDHVDGVVLTFVEITARMEAEIQSRRLAAVLRDSNDAIMLLDLAGRITSWNRGAERLYGYSEAEALKLTLGDLVPQDERARQKKLLKRSARGEEVESLEIHQ
ncbi:MAG TPA: chemotaxis protein CheB, partial [Planctomycetaceae bacterium]|nr:chemotaxis protein CheB [Planctomycetaceae bacterium]